MENKHKTWAAYDSVYDCASDSDSAQTRKEMVIAAPKVTLPAKKIRKSNAFALAHIPRALRLQQKKNHLDDLRALLIGKRALLCDKCAFRADMSPRS
eukprot:gene10429-3205_t